MIHAVALTVVLLFVDSDSSSPPVAIRSCSTGIKISGMLYKTDGNYKIDFVNLDTRNASAIGFVVHLGAQTILIKDEGTFTPGTNVEHRFTNRGGEVATINNPTISCSLRWVRFADGTRWDATGDAGN
jgi:hypothetical protein